MILLIQHSIYAAAAPCPSRHCSLRPQRRASGSRLHFWCFWDMKRLRGLLPQDPQVVEWEQKLNALVYELYRLTNEEIRIIEEAMK